MNASIVEAELIHFLNFLSRLSLNKKTAWAALFGALIGDAIGAPLEFLGRTPNEGEIKSAMRLRGGGVLGLAPGQITDDGEMTLALFHAVREENGRYNPEIAASNYINWAYSGPIDIGGATNSALKTGGVKNASTVYRRAIDYNQASQANGALMRATPLALVGSKLSIEETIEIACADTRLTHPNIICQQCTAAYVLAIRHLILNPGDTDGAFEAAESYLFQTQGEPYDWLVSTKKEDALEPALKNIGHVKIGFKHAFFHLIRKRPYREAIIETLKEGGDTDTNSCIVGGLVGAYDSAADLPKFVIQHKQLFLSRNRFEGIDKLDAHPISVIR